MIAVWLGLLAATQELPLRPGARWVYVQDGREVMILDATEATGETITLRVRGGSFFWTTEGALLSVGAEGLRCHATTYSGHVLPKDPPRLLLPPRLEKGARWEPVDGFFRATVVDLEKVDVPAGSFEAWKIDYVLAAHLGTEQDFRAWYAPGTGFVRLEYWQESTLGRKTPLEKPYRRDLARFEPKRVVRPLEVPPLSADERAAADRLLDRLSDPAVDVRSKAAVDLFARGRGVMPLLRDALAKTADPEVRARLRSVLDRFPALEFTARLTREKGQVGRPLPLAFALRNLSSEPARIVPAIDDSDVARSPRYLLKILDDRGVPQEPKEIPFCAHVNPLLASDFVTLEPGEEFDPLGPGSFGHYMLRWTPSRPGTYTLDATYDATGKIPEAWKGAGELDPAALRMLEAMPRGRYEARRLTIVVEP
jgi:hypothetical protein